MREHDLLGLYNNNLKKEKRMSVDECVNTILLAADKRARKVIEKFIFKIFKLKLKHKSILIFFNKKKIILFRYFSH